MFSAGCVLAGLLLRREPLFRGRDNEDQLARIACLLGTDALHAFLRRYGLTLDARAAAAIAAARPPAAARQLSSLAGPESQGLASEEGLELAARMLTYDHQSRITARDWWS
jgi:casein kinase II subunit alpha